MNETVREATPVREWGDVSVAAGSVLSDELLERIGARADGYDRENRFFYEDLEDLKSISYLCKSDYSPVVAVIFDSAHRPPTAAVAALNES